MSLHPIIQRELNDEQQAAVVQMENCIVAAGAGSGKTRVLAYRYAHLVIEHNFPVDSILTLTFTKKATAEMFERIYNTLKIIADSNESTSIQRERAKLAIENFHTSRIQTLDSYCSTIVRNASKQYGIRPDFTIDNEKIKDFCKQRAIEYMLTYRNNSAMKELIGNDIFEDVTDALFVNPIMYYSNIAQEIDFFGFIQIQIETVLKEWNACLDALFFDKDLIIQYKDDSVDFYEKIESTLIDITEIKYYFNAIKNNTIESSYLEKVKKSIIDFLRAYYSLTKIPKPRAKDTEDIKVAIDRIRNTYKTLTSLSQYILFFPQTLEVLPILQKYQEEITEWKRSSGILSFTDVSSLALKTLIEYPEMRKTEKLKINAIMIDEFQDNNAMQKDMLFLLTEKLNRTEKSIPKAEELCPEKLFFVGDEKQSIYKFRGADVSVFRELKNDLKHTLTLSTNYRSHPELIAGFNTIFGGYEYKGLTSTFYTSKDKTMRSSVFIQNHQLHNEVELPIFEADYETVLAKELKEDEKKDIAKKRIHICLLDNTKEDSDTEDFESDDESTIETQKEDLVEAENLAIYTSEKIAELCKSTYKPKDIAILFRSYSKQSMYEKHLRRMGIPYVTENITNFFGDAPINDILSFMRLLVYPMDTMSFSVFLASPFVRLTKQETLSCILNSILAKEVLFCEECALHLQGDSKKRYIDAMDMYNELREKAHSATCAQIVHDLWYNFGYRYETMWNEGVSVFAELYDYAFDIARKIDKEGNNLSYFVDYLYTIHKNSERLDDMNIPLEREGAVQLMSIHKSKGLEFPVVFIAGSTSNGKASYNSDKMYVDKTFGPSINFPKLSTILDCNSNYFYTLSKILETQMNEAELRRVLYVAMTRSETELYVTGSYTRNKKVIEKLEKSGIVFDFNKCKDDTEKEELLYDVLSTRFECALAGKKSNTNNTQVEFDYCIQNNSLFAFLLPIISECKNINSPFKLHVVDSVTRDDITTLDKKSKKIDVLHVQKRIAPIYESAKKITTPSIESPYRSPSQLSNTHNIEITKNDNLDSGEHAIVELDEIIQSKNSKNFDYSHFGTIAHAYAESLFTKQNPIIPAGIINILTNSELQTVCLIAKNMAEKFSTSVIGKEALLSNWIKVEHDFKLLVKKSESKKIIIKGQIDLLYENEDGKIVIIDYKTDSVENPMHHVPQLAAYRLAVAKMYNKAIEDISCVLYYLRTGCVVNITKETSSINLEQLVFE